MTQEEKVTQKQRRNDVFNLYLDDRK